MRKGVNFVSELMNILSLKIGREKIRTSFIFLIN